MSFDHKNKRKKLHTVVDTIGFGDTKLKPEQIIEDLKFAVTESVGGVLAILFCTDNRIDKNDIAILDILMETLGEEVKIIHVITKCDTNNLIELKDQANYIKTANENLQYIMAKTGNPPVFACLPSPNRIASIDVCQKLEKEFRTEIFEILVPLNKPVENDSIKKYRDVISGKVSWATFSIFFGKTMLTIFNLIAKKYISVNWVTDIGAWLLKQVQK